MKAMLMKELLQLRRTCSAKTVILFIVSVLCISVMGVRTNILLWFIIFSFNSYAVGAILRLDVPTFWNRWCVIMPVSRGDVVKSKYALALFYELIALAAVLAGMYVFLNVHNAVWITEVRYAVSAMSFLLMIDTVKLTCIFWRGGYHGGNISYVINILIFIVYLLAPISFSSNFAWFFLAFSLALRAASLPFSVWLYERRSL